MLMWLKKISQNAGGNLRIKICIMRLPSITLKRWKRYPNSRLKRLCNYKEIIVQRLCNKIIFIVTENWLVVKVSHLFENTAKNNWYEFFTEFNLENILPTNMIKLMSVSIGFRVNFLIAIHQTVKFTLIQKLFSITIKPQIVLLEHNLFKNVKNWVTFLWQRQVHYVKYETDKKETSNIGTLLIYTLWHKFSNDFGTQSDFGKLFVT